MKRLLLVLALLFAPLAAHAQIVGSFPYTFTNGTTADANQVMANYNYLKTSVNNGALPLTGGALTGGLSGTTLALSSLETVGGTLTVTGATTLNSTLGVTGASTLGVTGITGGLSTDTLAVSSTSVFTGALTASAGVVGAVTGNASTATTLATGRTLAITGDLTWTSPSFNGSTNVTAAGTLATVNSNVGTFGTSTVIPRITTNGKGLITAVGTNAIPTADNVGTVGLATLAPNADAITGTSTTEAVTPAGLAGQIMRAHITSLSSSPTVSGGRGIASVTRLGTGHYTINFTPTLANTSFTFIVTMGYTSDVTVTAVEDATTGRTTSSVTVFTQLSGSGALDPPSLDIMVIPN